MYYSNIIIDYSWRISIIIVEVTYNELDIIRW